MSEHMDLECPLHNDLNNLCHRVNATVVLHPHISIGLRLRGVRLTALPFSTLNLEL